MGLLDVVRSGVKIADNLTKDLQASVTYERWASDDGYGTDVFAAAVTLRAIVDRTQKKVRTAAGQEVTCSATITLLDPAALGTGVGVKDKFTLPGGFTGPVLNTSGFIDRGTGLPVVTDVYLG